MKVVRIISKHKTLSDKQSKTYTHNAISTMAYGAQLHLLPSRTGVASIGAEKCFLSEKASSPRFVRLTELSLCE